MATNNFKIFLSNAAISVYNFFREDKEHKNIEMNTLDFKSIIIFSTTALGDLLLNTPAIRSVRKRYPEAKITLVSSSKNKHIVEGSTWFSEVVYWDQKINDLPYVIRKLRKNKPDLAILLHSKSPYDVLCASLSGCLYILKECYSDKDLALKRWLTVTSGPWFDGHLIERKLSLVSSLGCDTRDITMSIPTFIKKGSGEKKSEIVVAFQLGASHSLRRWPVPRFQELARLLFSSGKEYRVALIGSSQEIFLATAFMEGISEEESKFVMNYVGVLSLGNLVEKISEFDVLITGDTGPLHIAIALQISTVSLFVTANPDYTGPIQNKELHAVIKVSSGEREIPYEFSDQPMSVITAHEVMSAINKMEL